MGAFPFTSQPGNRYIMVAIHLDAYNIFVEPMQGRSTEEMIRAYKKTEWDLHVSDSRNTHWTMKPWRPSNNASENNRCNTNWPPPGNHQCNQAEPAIKTFKAHFISILARVNNKFPLSLWWHLLKPTELTFNLLHKSKVAPKISAFAYIHRPHNYMKKLFAPLGCAIQANVEPEDCHTWDTQSDSGFSIGTSIEHHRWFLVTSQKHGQHK